MQQSHKRLHRFINCNIIEFSSKNFQLEFLFGFPNALFTVLLYTRPFLIFFLVLLIIYNILSYTKRQKQLSW